MRILTVCTANQCRSVMMAAALRHAFEQRGAAVEISSGGVAALAGQPATPDTVDVIARRGWRSVHDHRATHVAGFASSQFDLVLTAERGHLVPTIEALQIERFRAYAFQEFADLMTATAAAPGEPLEAYLRRLNSGRGLDAFLGVGRGPVDVADPTGKARRAHRKTLTQLERPSAAIARGIPLPWPPPVPG